MTDYVHVLIFYAMRFSVESTSEGDQSELLPAFFFISLKSSNGILKKQTEIEICVFVTKVSFLTISYLFPLVFCHQT